MDKLDYFAGLAMHSLIINSGHSLINEPEIKNISNVSVYIASVLVAESDRLKKAQKKGSANGKV
jgi:hypothetical protein